MSDKSKTKTIIPFFHMQVPLATAYRATSNQKPYRIKTSEKREEKRREEERREEKRALYPGEGPRTKRDKRIKSSSYYKKIS